MSDVDTTEPGRAWVFGDDVDTDQIAPSRFIVSNDPEELGEHAFNDLRPEFAETVANGDFVVGGHNFGSGSSREHAPWALVGYGFQAVVSTDFADIFRNNALKNGLVPVAIPPAAHGRLKEMIEADPAATVVVDLAGQTLTLPDGEKVGFPIDPFARHCLLNGVDQLGFLQSAEEAIDAYERERPARVNTLSEVPE